MELGDWFLMASMYAILLPGLIAVFAAIWRYGPDVAKEARENEGAKQYLS